MFSPSLSCDILYYEYFGKKAIPMETKPQSRVLIVDDMRVNRMILSSLLASNGVLADLAESGEECLALCRENRYDLILLDHRMPGIDGVDTFVQLKELFKEQGREVPVVCHTVEAARDNVNLYKAAGFAEALIKPIQPQRLSEVLMTYLPEGSVEDHRKRDDEEMKLKEELAKLPDWLSGVPGLDLSFGMGNCETADDYMDALAVFEASVVGKADEIEKLLDEEDISHYTLKVHSLKSMARLVGALGLSEIAAEMEAAGKENNLRLIREKTPKLLSMYRSYAEHLAPLAEEGDA